MDRNLANKLRPTELHFMLERGGIGDSVARMPAIKYVLETAKHVTKARVFCQDHFTEFARHLFKPYGNRIEIYGYSQMAEVLEKHPNVPAMMTDSKHHTTLRTHLTDHAFACLADTQSAPKKSRNYLRVRPHEINFKHPIAPYVVLCTGFTAPVREWLPQYVNEVADYLKGRGVTPVLLGSTENKFWEGRGSTKTFFREEVKTEGCIDLRDKTTLLEAAKVIAHARAICGVDNGLLHVAGCTDTPIIAGYTSVAIMDRMPIRECKKNYVFTAEKLACSGCQTQMNFVFDFDFRTCYFGDYKCILEMKSSKFIDVLEEVLQ